MGKRSSESLQDCGVRKEQIHEIGSIDHDIYRANINFREQIRTKLLNDHNLSPDLKTVLFATTFDAGLSYLGEPNVYLESLDKFLHTCARLASNGLRFNCLIKDRPANANAVEAAKKIVAKYTDRLKLAHVFGPPHAWVLASDAVVAINSTILIDAIINGLPAINLYAANSQYSMPSYYQDEVNDTNYQNLGEMILMGIAVENHIETLREKSRRVASRFVPSDGATASQRFANAMAQIF
jgi:hypothetical protein